MNLTRAGSESARLSVELSQTVQALVRVSEHQPAIPASEMCAALRYLAVAEFGLAQACEQLAACVRRSADDGLFWTADTPAETALAAQGLRMAARRLDRAVTRSTEVGTLLSDARQDIMFEGQAIARRLRKRGSDSSDSEHPDTPDAPPVKKRRGPRIKIPRWADPVDVSTVDPAEWITPGEAAALLEMKAGTLATSWVTSHIGPRRYRVNGAFVYRRCDVEAVRDHRTQMLHGRPSAA